MEQVYRGMTVVDAGGPIGTVAAIDTDATTGNQYVHVQLHNGARRTLAYGSYTIAGDALRVDQPFEQDVDLIAGAARMSSARRGDVVEVEDGITIPVVEEEVVVRTRIVERGGVRVHKLVNEREEVVEQPTLQEDVNVERVPIGRVVDVVPEARQEGDTLVLPVLEEMLVVEKRLVLKEEIRITKRRYETVEQARVVLREEEVLIEDLSNERGGTTNPGTADASGSGTAS